MNPVLPSIEHVIQHRNDVCVHPVLRIDFERAEAVVVLATRAV